MGARAKAPAKRGRRTIDRPREPGAPYTVEQAAGRLNVSPRLVRDLCKSGELRSFKVGRLRRIAEADLEEYATRDRVAPVRTGPGGGGLTIPQLLKTRKPRPRPAR